MSDNTLFLRLEGPLQAWGDEQSKFVIRRTAEAPTKSGIIGLLCSALGVPRVEAPNKWLPELAALPIGVRIDRPGVRWWDYHTVGAVMLMRTAEGKPKPGPILSRREYLCDASFLVALLGEPALVKDLHQALQQPRWTLYLGRKCCPPSRPVLEKPPVGEFSDVLSALASVPWRKRLTDDYPPSELTCLVDWQRTDAQPEAPGGAEVWYDVPLSFEPPGHEPRFVVRGGFTVGRDGQVSIATDPAQNDTPPPLRPRANYRNTEYLKARDKRLTRDYGLCVFCKSPATTVQHITYRHAGGSESVDELRSLCRLCHDAVTMIEYGLGMGIDRIDPEESRWRGLITKHRDEIVAYRSLETRRRAIKRGLEPEEVE